MEKQAAASDDGSSVRSINCLARNNTSLFHSETFAGADRCVHSYWMVSHHRSHREPHVNPQSIPLLLPLSLSFIYLVAATHTFTHDLADIFISLSLYVRARYAPTLATQYLVLVCQHNDDDDTSPVNSFHIRSKANIFPTRVKCCMDEHVPVGSRLRPHYNYFLCLLFIS